MRKVLGSLALAAFITAAVPVVPTVAQPLGVTQVQFHRGHHRQRMECRRNRRGQRVCRVCRMERGRMRCSRFRRQ